MGDRRSIDALVAVGDLQAVVDDLAAAVAGARARGPLDAETVAALRGAVIRASVDLGDVAEAIGAPLAPVEARA